MDEEVTAWIKRLGAGDSRAQQVIWEKYFDQLLRAARRKLASTTKREADEEDVVLSAFGSFFRGVEAGKFPKLDDRNDLWKLLVTIAARKAHAHRRRLKAKKRGGGRVRGESVFRPHLDGAADLGIDQFLAEQPSPQTATIVAETFANMLDKLEDETLQNIATLKMQGYANDEIAERLSCVRRTVERKLRRIRSIWSQVELR